MQQGYDDWTIFSSHGMVLFHVAANPNSTQRELSDLMGITERQIGRIVKDLASAGFLQVQRVGRRNTYVVNPNARLRHPTLAHIPLQRIMAAVVPELKQHAEISADA